MPEQTFYKVGISLGRERGIRSLTDYDPWKTDYRVRQSVVRPDGTPMFVFTNKRDAAHFLEGLSWFYRYEVWEGYTTQPLMPVPPRILSYCPKNGLLFWEYVRQGTPIPVIQDRSFKRDVYWDTYEPVRGTALVMDFTITRMVHVQWEHRPN